jgi:hypothetical protein
LTPDHPGIHTRGWDAPVSQAQQSSATNGSALVEAVSVYLFSRRNRAGLAAEPLPPGRHTVRVVEVTPQQGFLDTLPNVGLQMRLSDEKRS